MGHKPSNKIYPQKVVQPQIWFTLHFLPGTNIETFFCEIKIAMLSSPLYWDICPNWFQKSIEGLGKKYRPTFLPSFLTNHLWPVWFKAPLALLLEVTKYGYSSCYIYRMNSCLLASLWSTRISWFHLLLLQYSFHCCYKDEVGECKV